MLKTENHTFKGLQQDISISKQQPEYLIDAHNIRITAREGETLLSVTNEKGPKTMTLRNTEGNIAALPGTILGHCVLNNYLILFLHDDKADYITRIDMSKEEPVVFNLFQGEDSKLLGFDVEYPIEAIGSYENENIQKVYWSDGKNQPRVINIVRETPYTWSGAFDFVPTLKLNETVEIAKDTNASGQFPAGVIQYAFSYYNKYGQETNIFYTTKLYCVAYKDRGGSPEDIISIAFNIKVRGVDIHFDYLRIYSIERTSLNATPICKRVTDIDLSGISGNTITYTDTGTNGDNVDPSTLLYIGGEEITAQTLAQKDGTLFLGNISIKRPDVLDEKTLIHKSFNDKINSNGDTDTESIVKFTNSNDQGTIVSTGSIPYVNTIDFSGLKSKEYYRFGLQFQYKTGKWSEPIWIKDAQVKEVYPSIDETTGIIQLPQVQVSLQNSDIITSLVNKGYKQARLLMASPSYKDRSIICQGIANSTLYQDDKRHTLDDKGVPTGDKAGSLYAQSSWLFRPKSSFSGIDSTAEDCGGYIPSGYRDELHTVQEMEGRFIDNITYPSPKLRSTEVGVYSENGAFKIDQDIFTIHAPELIFDESLYNLDWDGLTLYRIGETLFTNTFGDIDIQTSSATIGSAQGFIHKSMKTNGDAALVSGLFYEDFIVDDRDSTPTYGYYDKENIPVSWPVYLWHKNGALNNDISRSGTSSTLLKKRISNYHLSTSSTRTLLREYKVDDLKLFQSNEISLIKVDGKPYMGNIDTLVTGDEPQFKYIIGNPFREKKDTTLTSNSEYRLGLKDPNDETSQNGIFKYDATGKWVRPKGDWGNIGDYMKDLCKTSEPVRIKYKSTPHLVGYSSGGHGLFTHDISNCTLPLVEVVKEYNADTYYGGQSLDALKANQWIPISDPVHIYNTDALTITSNRGDTYYQRFECLKTYAFTTEDINQVIDIASFMIETHLNIDGRYDRNRGQISNLNMSPTNFNLYNPVYSQLDNFFTYRILDDSYYKITSFPNQVTWTTEKQSNADIDNWTTITLASTYDMDGDNGEIQALQVWKNNIYCFQDQGVCNILFNSRVQIPTSDGVPIEITNNYKVDGKTYISTGIGCTNKFAICNTPIALYFVDSIGGHLQAINDQGLADLSLQKCMVTWLNKQPKTMWKPNNYTIRLFFDKNNRDLYVVNKDEALCYSEAIGEFISFMSYDEIPVMYNVVDKFYCVKQNYINEMFAGEYNNFFGEYQGYDITFAANGKSGNEDLSLLDKIYNNIDFRADKWSDALDSILSQESPFDYLRVWNEYQDTGEVLLIDKPNKTSILKKKFRVWRIQIPRDAHNRRDRIRNTWCKIKLGSSPKYDNGNNGFIQLHDAVVQYFV